MLKSDHFGIEIRQGKKVGVGIIIVKIRPFWDWNKNPIDAEVEVEELKSDHFGIEISSQRVLNEERKKLKSDHFGIEIFLHFLI